ncbi:MAG: acetyl-CoA synthase subunit gamma [bacterium]|nr:acetyl-CoA synthase subunit gamma [bacterium]
MSAHYIIDQHKVGAREIPLVSTTLTAADAWGNFKVRFSIGRMNYTIEPGLYGVGNPGKESPVLVSANYKLSFDALRKELKGLDAWILVLDTKGVNVWCAAGKKTFGTDELVRQIRETDLDSVVSHRKLVLPQLGAPGIAGFKVKKATGFSVIYGPVRASDIPAYLEAGFKATDEMRRVRFTFKDRVVLLPVEGVYAGKYMLFITAVFFLLSGLHGGGYSLDFTRTVGFNALINLLWAYLAGVFLGPLLLPWLPTRSFSIKGFFAGAAVFAVSLLMHTAGAGLLEMSAWFLLITGISSFFTLNYTGSTTFTSLSGVKKEMASAIPIQATAGILGSILWVTARFV